MEGRTPHGPPLITERQLEVARLVASGMSNSEIAETLGISLDGAKHHVTQLLTRLDLQRRREIVAWYRREHGRRRRLRALLALPLAGWAAAAGAMTAVVAVGVIGVGAFLGGGAPASSFGCTPPSDASVVDVSEVLGRSGLHEAEFVDRCASVLQLLLKQSGELVQLNIATFLVIDCRTDCTQPVRELAPVGKQDRFCIGGVWVENGLTRGRISINRPTC